MYILGLSAFYHDSAAVLLKDGGIVAAAQEERFSRKKHDSSFPDRAVKYCLAQAQIKPQDLDHIVFYDKPFIKFERLLLTYLSYAPKGIRSFLSAMPPWIKQKLFIRTFIEDKLQAEGKILFCEHHLSHAASAFYPSPFKEAAVLTIDGVGEWATASYGQGQANKLDLESEIIFPHSLGLLYSAFTYYIGFRVNSGEYKLMGLAPYGEPKYSDLIKKELIDIKEDGSFRLNMKYFNYCAGLTMTSRKFHKLFGGRPRIPDKERLEQRHMDLAASAQAVTEEVVLKMAKNIRRKTGQANLCLAGGVGLNCVANGKVLKQGIFDNLWIQPAAGDAGGALGAAYLIWYDYLKNERIPLDNKDSMKASLLGPQFSDRQIEDYLKENDIVYEKLEKDKLTAAVARIIAGENVLGWFQGRMEYGPRALGNRSILGDPRSAKMQRLINLKIKFRESFRPFAPAVLAEYSGQYFDLDKESPYMLLVAPVHQKKVLALTKKEESLFGIDKLGVKRSDIPAVTHVDYSARVQTVKRDDNALYYDMINEFYKITGCPLVINTSFNVRGEPIVCEPKEAYNCFMRTNMDYLVIGSFLLDKKKQKGQKLKVGDLSEFEPD